MAKTLEDQHKRVAVSCNFCDASIEMAESEWIDACKGGEGATVYRLQGKSGRRARKAARCVKPDFSYDGSGVEITSFDALISVRETFWNGTRVS